MDFVDKENVIFLKIGKKRGEIPGFFNGGAGGNTHIYAHFVGNNCRHGGFAEARRPCKEDVVKRLSAHFSSLNKHAEIILGLFLTDIFGKKSWTERNLAAVLGKNACGCQCLLEAVFGKTDAHIY